jgi:hypothetical protein
LSGVPNTKETQVTKITAKDRRFRAAWANRLGLEVEQVNQLLRLVDRAVNAQVREHNEENAPSSDRKCKAVEDYAATLGFTCDWNPGLYPVLIDKAGHRYDLPN